MDAACASSRKRSAPAGVNKDDGGGVDRLSALPDVLLGEIITLLPTKEGARTQILSPRWRHLWSSSPLNLDISNNYSYAEGWDKLVQVVSRVLSAHAGPGRRFSTRNIGDRYAAAVDGWLRSPALDNLQEIEFKLGHCYLERPPALIFRFSSTLRVVNIGGYQIPDFIVQGLRFPVLQQLGLDTVTISESSLHSIIGSCPVLQSLLITCCFGFRCIRIDSVTLRGFGCHRPYDSGIFVLVDEIIIHNAPCLERLLLHSSTATRVLVVAAPKLETVGIGSYSDANEFVFCSTVIQGLPCDKLAMVVRTVKILLVDMIQFSLDMAIEFITCFSCLEKLYIQVTVDTESNNLWRRKHKDLVKSIDLSLKTIVLEWSGGFRGIKQEVNFVTFFVLNARLLESFTLWVCSFDYNEEFLKELRRKLQLEKSASRAARFHFTTKRILRSSMDLKHVHDLESDPFVK